MSVCIGASQRRSVGRFIGVEPLLSLRCKRRPVAAEAAIATIETRTATAEPFRVSTPGSREVMWLKRLVCCLFEDRIQCLSLASLGDCYCLDSQSVGDNQKQNDQAMSHCL